MNRSQGLSHKITCINVVTTSQTSGNLSRHQLIVWINEVIGMNVKKVEELCSGAVYCKLLSELFPGVLNLKRIKLNAIQAHEYIQNLKVLQASFQKIGCDKLVPIDRLVKGRFQDNFEFLQWFKKFYAANKPTPSLHSLDDTFSEVSAFSKLSLSSSEAFAPFVDPVTANLKDKIYKQESVIRTLIAERDCYCEKLTKIGMLCTKVVQEKKIASGSDMMAFIENVMMSVAIVDFEDEDY